MNQLFGLQHRGVRPFCASMKRNPRVYDGEFITVTRRSNGSYHPVDKNFSVERYISGVDLELHKGLEGLVEE